MGLRARQETIEHGRSGSALPFIIIAATMMVASLTASIRRLMPGDTVLAVNGLSLMSRALYISMQDVRDELRKRYFRGS